MWGQVADRLITPVVAQPAFDQERVVHVRVHGEQLDGGHTEPLQVLHRGRVLQAGVGAAQRLGDVGVEFRESLDVDLVEDRIGHCPARPPILAPVEIVGRQQRTRDVRRRVLVIRSTRVVGDMAVHRRVPPDIAGNRAGVRVEQQFCRVAPRA